MATEAHESTAVSAKRTIPGGSFLIEERQPEEIFTPEDFTEQHRLIAETAEQFVRNEVLPCWEQIEHQEPGLTPKLLRQAGELGLLSLDVPEKYGGMEMDKVASTIVAERIAEYASFAASFGAQTGIGTLPIVFFGNEEQKQKYLPRLATGELLAAYCLSEAEAGSDALAARARATLSPDGKHWLLNGEKMWITNGGFADLYNVFAKVDGEKFSCFIVERGFPGVSTGAEEKKLGIKGSSTCAVILDNVPVPVENLLGEVGRGHIIAFNILNIGRFKLAAAAIGGAKRSLLHSVTYAKQRRAFGRTIAEFGLMQEKLAEMAARIFAGESMIYRTAGLMDTLLADSRPDSPEHGTQIRKAIEEYAVECSINKVYCSEALDYVTDQGVQIYGGYGYHQDYPAERAYRDARINRIWEGTNEINRMVITNMLLKRAATGQLALIPAATRLLQEILSHSPLPPGPGADGLLVEEKRLVRGAKKAALLLTGLAYQKYANSLAEQQEILAAIADIVMEAYALESAVLRSEKIAAREGEERAAHAVRMTHLLVHSRMDVVDQRARTTLAAISSGEARRAQGAALQQFTQREPVDIISLRRQVAAQVIHQGKYST
ncbi:MAG: acyl-CoA dehydrogenase family protein [Acidobacteria bacterium]|nr:acyl-CoA dehydrogenase family protein [Acidobacteriota bacterium]